MEKMFLWRNPNFTSFNDIRFTGFVSSKGQNHYYSDEFALLSKITWEVAYKPISVEELTSTLQKKGFKEKDIDKFMKMGIDKSILIYGSQEDIEIHYQSFLSRFPAISNRYICQNLIVCISGAVGSSLIIPYLQLLRVLFCRDMKIILTQNATKFITPDALRYNLHVDIYQDVFMDNLENQQVAHIMLAKWADCILAAPASAALIHRIANSSCEDLTSLVITAAKPKVPIIIAPNMNVNMWMNPVVQKNIGICQENGYWIIQPGYASEANELWNTRSPELGGLGFFIGNMAEVLSQICSQHRHRLANDSTH